ncbi:MAG: type II toxin-antitoxin system RelE/ParE family toxin [Ilumatobacteraceae bacterium]
MSTPVRFGPEATTELEDAARWYEQRHAGLGLSFLAAVDDVVESIRRWPRAGAVVAGLEALDIRRVPISRFPYHVAYLITDEQIHVIAVAHDRRRPMYWGGRTGI